MGIRIHRVPGGVDVTRRNAKEVLYLIGDESTDESIRIILDAGIAEIQKRINGVWNASELELGKSTLFLGHNLSLAAIGESLQIGSVEGNKKFLVLDIPFNDTGTSNPRVPVVDQRFNHLVVQPDDSVERVLQSATRSVSFPSNLPGAFGHIFYFKTGSVAATEPVELRLTEGPVLGGPLIFDRFLPANEFLANTEVSVEVGVGFVPGEDFIIELKSDADFSVLGSTTVDLWMAVDFQDLIFENLLVDNQTLSREACLTFDRESNFVIGRTF